MSSQFAKFKETLQSVFMLDQADLDFGIYRIMNQKRTEINNYLNLDLAKQVKEILAQNSGSKRETLLAQLEEARTQAIKLGVDPNSTQKAKELQAKLAAIGNPEELENEVYDHLSQFFSRYYKDGDFISQRRYKKDVYAIPYEGEEVKFYWANANQYYIKTGEYFRTYSFKLSADKQVEFVLVDATTEQSNNKAQNNMERRFALYEKNPIERVDGKLHIHFTYELWPKTVRQAELISQAYDTIRAMLPGEFTQLMNLSPTEKDKNRTLLKKHLNNYVARNTFDYFIHTDLTGFLTRELDFYIKNEILFIDDLEKAEDRIQSYFSVMKAVKAIGEKIITFLASLENFQKRLWLKKKFVYESNYCITLDRIPEELYAIIAANQAQREEWIRLFAIDKIESSWDDASNIVKVGYSEPLSIDFLKQNPFLILDTAFFDTVFRQRLLESIPNLDEQTDGLIISSENFQALNLLQEKYKASINNVYIDPPYNAKSSEICYKNTYKHSSWNTFISNRISLSKKLLSEGAIFNFAIDDYEVHNALQILFEIFGEENHVGNITVQHNPRGRNDDKFFGTSHEYMLVFSNDAEYAEIGLFPFQKAEFDTYTQNDDISLFSTVSYIRTGNNSRRFERPNLFYPIYCNPDTMELSLEAMDGWKELLPIAPDGEEKTWRWGKDTFLKKKDTEILVKPDGNTFKLYKKRRADEKSGKKPKTVWFDSKYDASSHGIMLLRNLFGKVDAFSYPKSINTVYDALQISMDKSDTVLDYFAGSGTTGHAIINLNRKDGGRRKYILVEMGEYFDTVTKPRIEKVIYSKDWKDGMPVSREGSSHCMKYIRLEGYEDTLNNLVLKQTDSSLFDPTNEFRESYLLGYMLDTESRESLFNTDWFINPFDIKLNITRRNEKQETRIDLVDTFNYLIGLYVNQIAYPQEGICTVFGTTRNGEHILVIWRDCNQINNEALDNFFYKNVYSLKSNKIDRIYVNGDSNLEKFCTDVEHWKVFLTEKEFNKRMFEE